MTPNSLRNLLVQCRRQTYSRSIRKVPRSSRCRQFFNRAWDNFPNRPVFSILHSCYRVINAIGTTTNCRSLVRLDSHDELVGPATRKTKNWPITAGKRKCRVHWRVPEHGAELGAKRQVGRAATSRQRLPSLRQRGAGCVDQAGGEVDKRIPQAKASLTVVTKA